MGDYTLRCCDQPAVQKTSPTGLQFFAHLHDECTTAPESQWHRQGKDLVQDMLISAGVHCRLEVSGDQAGARWTADVYAEHGQRKIAIELQHSYQSLWKYRERQKRYFAAGVECYWLLYPEGYRTLVKTMGKERLQNDLRGVHPPPRFFPLPPRHPRGDKS